MTFFELIGILTVMLAIGSAAIIGINHYKFKQWLKDEWKAGRR
jgi:hypothetical protein